MSTRIQILLLSYFLVGVLSLVFGVLLPETMSVLSPYAALFLGAIFFLSSLSINIRSIVSCLKDVKLLLTVVVSMLFIFAGITYVATQFFAPQFTVAFVLLAAMPVGMTAPLLATISGGRQDLALTLAVATSLLAPLTIPLIIKLFLGTAVSVSFWSMFIDLATIIFIPFILAQIATILFRKTIQKVTPLFTPLSLLFLGFLITGIIGQQVITTDGFTLSHITPSLLGVVLLFSAFHIIGFYLVFWRTVSDRITISICLTYMNFSLAIYLASEFFDDPATTLTLVTAIVPWVLMLPLFRFFTLKLLPT